METGKREIGRMKDGARGRGPQNPHSKKPKQKPTQDTKMKTKPNLREYRSKPKPEHFLWRADSKT